MKGKTGETSRGATPIQAGVLLLAWGLRLYCLTCSSLWHDEGNTWAMVQRSFAAIAQAAAADIHPPGYYWLLRVWSLALGTDAWALRAFSAFAGLLTVALVMALARHLIGRRDHPLVWGGGLLAAVHPFAVYYSQEARMYALLMLEGTVLLYAVVRLQGGRGPTSGAAPIRSASFPLALYGLAGVLGLWTHYIFPVMLAVGGLVGLGVCLAAGERSSGMWRRCGPFLAVNGLVLALYLPWLPTAVERVLHWPAGGVRVGWSEGARLTLQTLALGPIRQAPSLSWPWLALVGLLPMLGLAALGRRPGWAALALWLLAPVAVMAGLGLYSEAFLKFLLVAAPAWTLLSAVGLLLPGERLPGRLGGWSAALLGVTGAGLLAVAGLPGYYTDPLARDNYAGMARTVAALADPQTDRVVLDAPGQQEVWAYYDPGVPVLALPRQRPPDRAATEAELARSLAGVERVFALFWATDQADPEGIVEGWLDRHGFKGLESWQGNVRFVLYRMDAALTCREPPGEVRFGDVARLQAACLPTPATVTPGDVLPVELVWQALTAPTRRYKVTLQVLDPRAQVLAQRDGEPVGGARPTLTWQAGEIVRDRHGVYVPPGTPPGAFRLLLALYDPETGVRLPVQAEPSLAEGWTGLPPVEVVRPARPLPPDIVPMQRRVGRRMGPVMLLGADVYRRGFGHAPETPVAPGDVVHVTLYWQAPDPLPADWPADLSMTLSLGGQRVTAPLAGGLYPVGAWQPGDVVRGEFDIPYDGGDRALWLEVVGERVRLGRIP